MTFQFPFAKWLDDRNWNELHNISSKFSKKTNGLFHGILGPADGLAIRIKCPCHPSIKDPGNYFSCKGFFCLNVQAMCDSDKRFYGCLP